MEKNFIIHFTKSFEILQKIISSNSLLLSYCKESFYMGDEKISGAAHPMVCFSEYSLSDLKYAKITYGLYGIAFSKAWASRNGINPVIYLDSTSQAAKGLATLLKARRNKIENKLPPNLRLAVMQIKCFTKNLTGYNSNLGVYDFNFKDENEWRFVPLKNDLDGFFISENITKYVNNKTRYNSIVAKYPLKFSKRDICFIFVPQAYEIDQIASVFNISTSKLKISNWKN